jgi:hypothetical protein
MKRTAYQMGLHHGVEGLPWMSHRKRKPYDSASQQASYNRGFADGNRILREAVAKGLARWPD